MRKAIADLWSILIESIRELPESGMRIVAIAAIMAIALIVLLAPLGMIFNFVTEVIELIVGAISGVEVDEMLNTLQ